MKNKQKEIKKILLDIVETLETISDEQDTLVRNLYEKHTKKHLDDNGYKNNDRDFYHKVVDMLQEKCSIEELFDDNDIAISLYYKNIETFNSLLSYATSVYELYDNLNIEYLEKAKNDKVEAIQIAQAKEFITIKEFSLLYEKSVKTQQAYRSRPQNPIPYIQKKLGDNVLYNKIEAENWLREKDLW